MIEAVSAAALLLAEGEARGPFGGCEWMMPSMLGILLLMYFFFIQPERKERQRKEQLRKELRKNDRVVTIGGVLGTVAGVSPDSNEVILKIDEATGAKLRVLRSAIHEVIRDETKEAKKDDPRKDDARKDDKKDIKPEDPKRSEPTGDGLPK